MGSGLRRFHAPRVFSQTANRSLGLING